MKRVTKPESVFVFNGELMRVSAISQGKVVHMVPLTRPCCPTCGNLFEISLLEDSMLFQQGAKPVETISE